MPFPEINTQSKTFLFINEKAEAVIQEDMHTFACDSYGVFVNTIIENFWEQADSSISFHLQSARAGYERILQKCSLKAKEKQEVINSLIDSEIREARERIGKSKKEKTELRHVIYLNKNSKDILFVLCDEQDIYDNRVSLYIKCLLEEYASLPYIQRERIFYKKMFEEIERACAENRLILVLFPGGNNKESKNKKNYIEVYPYRILPDSMNTRSYLACYGKTESDSKPKIASFRISTLKNCKITAKDGSLSYEEIEALEDAIQKRGVGFLLGEPTEIRIRLTDAGKKLYDAKLFSRPMYDHTRSDHDEYVFSCTEQQAFVYFHPFGKDAEILSPPSLRERMIQSYQKGLKQYKK